MGAAEGWLKRIRGSGKRNGPPYWEVMSHALAPYKCIMRGIFGKYWRNGYFLFAVRGPVGRGRSWVIRPPSCATSRHCRLESPHGGVFLVSRRSLLWREFLHSNGTSRCIRSSRQLHSRAPWRPSPPPASRWREPVLGGGARRTGATGRASQFSDDAEVLHLDMEPQASDRKRPEITKILII